MFQYLFVNCLHSLIQKTPPPKKRKVEQKRKKIERYKNSSLMGKANM